MPTGRTHYMSGAAAPIHHEDGTLAAVVETLYDLTERQHLQAELERARDAAAVGDAREERLSPA